MASLLARALISLHADLHPRPLRGLDKLKEQGVGLVIAVGCGVRAHREAKHAHSLGLDLIITEHNELDADSLSDAFAVIKRLDCPQTA